MWHVTNRVWKICTWLSFGSRVSPTQETFLNTVRTSRHSIFLSILCSINVHKNSIVPYRDRIIFHLLIPLVMNYQCTFFPGTGRGPQRAVSLGRWPLEHSNPWPSSSYVTTLPASPSPAKSRPRLTLWTVPRNLVRILLAVFSLSLFRRVGILPVFTRMRDPFARKSTTIRHNASMVSDNNENKSVLSV